MGVGGYKGESVMVYGFIGWAVSGDSSKAGLDM